VILETIKEMNEIVSDRAQSIGFGSVQVVGLQLSGGSTCAGLVDTLINILICLLSGLLGIDLTNALSRDSIEEPQPRLNLNMFSPSRGFNVETCLTGLDLAGLVQALSNKIMSLVSDPGCSNCQSLATSLSGLVYHLAITLVNFPVVGQELSDTLYTLFLDLQPYNMRFIDDSNDGDYLESIKAKLAEMIQDGKADLDQIVPPSSPEQLEKLQVSLHAIQEKIAEIHERADSNCCTQLNKLTNVLEKLGNSLTSIIPKLMSGKISLGDVMVALGLASPVNVLGGLLGRDTPLQRQYHYSKLSI
jgi:hypothetical protein